MGDKMRLMVTGVAAIGIVGLTLSGNSVWSMFDDDDSHVSRSASPAELRDFDGILLSGPDTVIVTPGKDFSVKAEGDGNALRYLTLFVKDGTLNVRRNPGKNGWWGAGGSPVTVRVTMPGLARVWITGSGDMSVDKVEGKEFAARLDGSGGLMVTQVKSNAVRLSLNGSGHMDLDGAAQDVSIKLVGSGNVAADGLTAQTADIDVAGSGEIVAHAAGNAKLTLNGSGHAQVAGTNRCQIRKAGSGEAECTS